MFELLMARFDSITQLWGSNYSVFPFNQGPVIAGCVLSTTSSVAGTVGRLGWPVIAGCVLSMTSSVAGSVVGWGHWG